MKGNQSPFLKPFDWPPLICASKVPFWIRARDLILTLLAWILMFYLLRGVAVTILEWMRNEPVLFMARYFESLQEFWFQLRPFARFAAVLMIWIGLWTLWRYRIFAGTQKFAAQPPDLDLESHSRSRNVPVPILEAWQDQKVVKIDFDEKGELILPQTFHEEFKIGRDKLRESSI
jgi:poly-beta-1,6-N-acetyl-D-glucosamine biosynthesis protein PgaD